MYFHNDQLANIYRPPTLECDSTLSANRSRTNLLLCLVTVGLIFGVVEINGAQSASQKSIGIDYPKTEQEIGYIGDESCRQCHLGKYESFKKTGMGRSMSKPLPDELGIFSKQVTVHNAETDQVYSIYTENGKAFHRQSQLDSGHKPVFSEAHEVVYSVGSGKHGQSYVIARGDFLFLSPLSYYTSVHKWDLSPGFETGLYRGFTRPVGGLCVSCHSGLPQPVQGMTNQYLNPPFRILSIGCERCHGPGAAHVSGQRAVKLDTTSLDSSIVNPRLLPPRLRDDVCYQCHLSGDARVQRPGKGALDFRPGTALDEVVSVFFVPASLKGSGLAALSQPEQILMSRCQQKDGSRLNCINCHDPHIQPEGSNAAEYYRSKCMECHKTASCGFDRLKRAATSPPDNCISCHMPKAQLTNIAHVAYTDHRIARRPTDAGKGLIARDVDPESNLIWATRPSNRDKPDLRTLALAFAQLAPNYPGYGQRGFPMLVRAASAYRDDADVQATYGEVLLAIGSPEYRARAKQALQRAVSLGSKSPTVRRRLAKLLIEDGDAAGFGLLREAMQLEPFNIDVYLQLARAQLAIGQRSEAAKTLEQALSFDRGNPDARRLLRELPP